MQKFYRLRNSAPSFGPLYPSSPPVETFALAGTWGFRLVQSDALLGHSQRSVFIEGMLRGVKFPGVFRCERPARGVLRCPAAADITNHSTLTLDDGSGLPAVVFEFVSSGSAGGGNQAVDISTATTGAEVAAALKAAIETYTASLSLSPNGDGSGFSASRADGSDTVRVIQAFPTKNENSPMHGQPYRGTWLGKTMGSFGNNAIVPSVAGEWTGRIAGMTGGKRRLAGCYARPAPGRSQAIPSFLPEIVPTPPLG